MSKRKIKFFVTNIWNGEEFVTYAVSKQDAINNIHFNLWFKHHIWTEMSDFEAESEAVLVLREIEEQAKREKKPSYHQLSLFEVAT